MRNWIRLAARLYPARWRQRYGEELDALIEDSGGGWRDVLDVAIGGISVQLAGRQAMIALGLTGLLLGFAGSVIFDPMYEARVGLKVQSSGLEKQVRETLTRGKLLVVVKQRGLYPDLEFRLPSEDIVYRMRHDLTLKQVGGSAAELAFRYSDPVGAKLAAADVAALLGPLDAQPTSARAFRETWIPAASGLLVGLLSGLLWKAKRQRAA
jgi:hypothetical protein